MLKAQGVEDIGKKDVVWSYLATFFQIGAGVILLPFILKMMPAETVGIWTIFQTITTLVALLDLGFNPSFARNVSYIFSGVNELYVTGVSTSSRDGVVNFSLLSGTIKAMKWFYSLMALIVLLLLLSVGTVYMHYVLETYAGDKADAFVAWLLLILINSYNLYTLYFDSLLLGKGYVKRSKQIMVIGQVVYLTIAIILILFGYGLVAVVSAQLCSIVIKRVLSYKVFFTKELKEKISSSSDIDKKEIIKAIFPNAIKVGLTSLGSFMVNKSAVLMGSIYLSLSEIANYGITLQVVGVLAALAAAYYQSYIPKLAQYRVENNMSVLKKIYVKSSLIQLFLFVFAGFFFVVLGSWALKFLGTEATFLSEIMIVAMLLIAFLERNHILSAGFLLAKNEVPFFKASLISGGATIFLLWLMIDKLHWGVWGMILAPGIAQVVYQNWKWPLVVIREFNNNK